MHFDNLKIRFNNSAGALSCIFQVRVQVVLTAVSSP